MTLFFKSVVLSAFVAAANAENLRSPVRFNDAKRQLSYDFIAGYRPDSSVTDHNAIDLDQKQIAEQVDNKSQDAFNLAKAVYEQGAHSKSYAKLTITSAAMPSLNEKDRYSGKTEAGIAVYGKVYKSDKSGDNEIYLQYDTSDSQSSYVNCQVGGLSAIGNQNTVGCFATTGVITAPDSLTTYTYNYDVDEDNDNGRTIKGFSTSVESKMLTCSGPNKGCPYRDAQFFKDYYGNADYADKWVEAALSGGKTDFASGRGDADFSVFDFTGRAECIKKGTAYMNVFMYVIREFEDALDDCKSDCIKCNDDPVHAWDEGVAFYTGSLEGERGETKGQLLHALADKRCGDYKTCVGDTDYSTVNQELFKLFSVGQAELLSSRCSDARKTKEQIVDMMYIPLIQGTMRYAHKVDKQGLDGEKEKAEGAVFAAAVLPRIYAANKDAAQTIYDNMKVGASSTDHKAVKSAFESVYGDLNINCADVGGLIDTSTDDYFDGAGPCKSGASKAGATVGIIAGVAGGAVALGALGYIFFLRGREKQGKPVFAPTSDERAL